MIAYHYKYLNENKGFCDSVHRADNEKNHVLLKRWCNDQLHQLALVCLYISELKQRRHVRLTTSQLPDWAFYEKPIIVSYS